MSEEKKGTEAKTAPKEPVSKPAVEPGGPTAKGWAVLMALLTIIGMVGFGLLVSGMRGVATQFFDTIVEMALGTFMLALVISGVALYWKRTREDPTRRITVQNWRIVSMLLWIGIVDMMAFGVPHFSTTPIGRYWFWPNLSSRFLVYDPTTCIQYEINLEILNGAQSYYVNIWVPLLIFYVMIFILGRFWCGWLCPIYLLQDGLGRIRSALKVGYLDLPPKVVMVLDRFKYVLLFIITFGGVASVSQLLPKFFRASTPLSCEICPARPICITTQQLAGAENWKTQIPPVSAAMGICVILLSFKIRNFWCRICPLGALMAIASPKALLRLEKVGSKCTRCRICARVCPMDIEEIYEAKGTENVTYPTCVHCYKCVEKCPEAGCLSVKFAGKTLMTSKAAPVKYGKAKAKKAPQAEVCPAK
jgi:Pyruvate/2-oxoacid:ferredoxin oxidoreductase delta subunit